MFWSIDVNRVVVDEQPFNDTDEMKDSDFFKGLF
jgi:hypothetical protein